MLAYLRDMRVQHDDMEAPVFHADVDHRCLVRTFFLSSEAQFQAIVHVHTWANERACMRARCACMRVNVCMHARMHARSRKEVKAHSYRSPLHPACPSACTRTHMPKRPVARMHVWQVGKCAEPPSFDAFSALREIWPNTVAAF